MIPITAEILEKMPPELAVTLGTIPRPGPYQRQEEDVRARRAHSDARGQKPIRMAGVDQAGDRRASTTIFDEFYTALPSTAREVSKSEHKFPS